MNPTTEVLQEINFKEIIEINQFVKRGYDFNNKYIELYYSNKGNIVLETFRNQFFTLYKGYHSNNIIKLKGLQFNSRDSFKKGIWYEFDQQGKLIKEIDYDKPFRFNFEDILKYCEKENIKIEKGYISQNGWHNIISRKIENNKPIWQIEHLKKRDLIEIITLDGITGKVLKKETEDYINN